MDFKIDKIKIQNFRCFDDFETTLWNKTIVRGSNEAGKTSLATAILWVLTGKDAEGNSTFEIVPNGKYRIVSPSVEIDGMIDDTPVTLKREYKAKFTRDKQFSDYATVTYINGIETGVKKFQEWVTDKICDEQVFKILSNTKTFAEDCPKGQKELLWQAQRRLLMSLITEQKTDKQICEESDDFSPLREPMKRFDSVSQYLTLLKKELSETQKSIDAFDIKISQQEKNIIQVDGSEEEIEKQLAELKAKASALMKENEQYKASQNIANSNQIQAEIEKLNGVKNNLIGTYNENMKLYSATKARYESEAEHAKQEVEQALKNVKVYMEALEKLKASKPKTVCETCGNKLKKEQVEEAQKRLQERIKNGQGKTAAENNRAMLAKKKYEEMSSKTKTLLQPVYPAQVKVVDDNIKSLTERLLKAVVIEDMPEYQETFESYQKQADALKEKYAEIKAYKKRNEEAQKEIESIENEHKENVKKLSQTQMLIDCCKEFISRRCKELEEKINSLFDDVSFELFEKNKSNDEVKETCVIRYRGIKYQDLSYSTKIIACLDIVKAFQKHYNVKVPCVIDNAESITDNLSADNQILLMYVQDELCEKCGGETGRRNADGTWTCKKCGNTWKKKLIVKEG